MFLLVSIGIFFQSISLHYTGDSNIEKFLFSGSNQLQKIEKCIDNCVSVKVNGKKVTLILRSQGESIVKNYDFSKNKVSQAQFADLLRLKIILFRKEYRKKIEKRFIHLLKYELETRIKSDLETKMRIELEEKINIELEKKIKSIQSELETKISLNLNNKQKENLKIELKKIKLKLKKELEKELEKRFEIILKAELKPKLELAKKELKKEIKLELKNEQLKKELEKQYRDLMLAGNINLGIKRDKITGGLQLEYKDVDNKNIIAYSMSYLMRTEGELSKVTTNFMLLQVSMGRKLNIYKNIDIELMLGGFSSIVNLLDKDDNWFFAWETAGGVLSSLNTSILITPNWGFTLKTEIFLFLVNYRNTDKDGLYGNRKMSLNFSLGGFFRF